MSRALKLKEGPSPVRKSFLDRDNFCNSKINPPFPVRAKRLWKNNNIDYTHIHRFDSKIPPWNLKKPCICVNLNNPKYRKNDSPYLLNQKALEHMQSHSHLFPIFTDGSKSEQGVGFAAIS